MQKNSLDQQNQTLKLLETLYPFKLASLDTGKFMYVPGKIGIFLMAIDHFTRWVEIKIVFQETLLAIESIEQEFVLNRYRHPRRI